MDVKGILPSLILFLIGLTNIVIALISPNYKLDFVPFALFVIFLIFAVMTFLTGRDQPIKQGSLADLRQDFVVDLPSDERFHDLLLEQRRTSTHLTGFYNVEGEQVRVELTHIKQKHLKEKYKAIARGDEKLLQDIRKDDKNALSLDKMHDYVDLNVNGKTIPAYVGEFEGKGERRPVFRGTMDLRPEGLLIISIAAFSKEALEVVVRYLSQMQPP
ncbi:MAG: hypothetical protein GWO20_09245 [Candidatus Korarchaeota archaeon]|nr:hypothetical protein [Candidatus Korarchaeota archaeon]NIU83593.1 hypothetical protein [Candidatus Thorarchaeota archaeon]NIW13838.1 hypothetical protein [Candidatus Thorarchaeota archaeon]